MICRNLRGKFEVAICNVKRRNGNKIVIGIKDITYNIHKTKTKERIKQTE